MLNIAAKKQIERPIFATMRPLSIPEELLSYR